MTEARRAVHPRRRGVPMLSRLGVEAPATTRCRGCRRQHRRKGLGAARDWKLPPTVPTAARQLTQLYPSDLCASRLPQEGPG